MAARGVHQGSVCWWPKLGALVTKPISHLQFFPLHWYGDHEVFTGSCHEVSFSVEFFFFFWSNISHQVKNMERGRRGDGQGWCLHPASSGLRQCSAGCWQLLPPPPPPPPSPSLPDSSQLPGSGTTVPRRQRCSPSPRSVAWESL